MRARWIAIALSMLFTVFLMVGTNSASAAEPNPALVPAGNTAPAAATADTDRGMTARTIDTRLSSALIGAEALPGVLRSAGSPGQVRAADDGPVPSIHGTLRFQKNVVEDGKTKRERVPVAGVEITVSQDGETIGSATSDDKGEWVIPVPKAGRYDVTLNAETLPEDVTLRDPSATTLEGRRVGPSNSATAVFALESGDASHASAEPSRLSYYLSMIFAGLRYGLIIAMAAVGLSLVFGTTGLINFAHGEMVTIGAVVTYVFAGTAFGWPFLVAILIGIVAVGLLGGLMELSLWRPLRKRGTGLIQMFIISIGLSLLLRHGVELLFGSKRRDYNLTSLSGSVDLGLISVPLRDLILMGAAVVVLTGVALMLQHTRMGKAMRALADNRDLAEASGIDVKRVILQVWIIGGGLAALGGVSLGLIAKVHWQMGWYLLLLMFAGVILGGLGSAYGAIIGSIVIGLVAQTSSIWFDSQMQNVWAMLILIVVLLVRPQGILGRLQRAG